MLFRKIKKRPHFSNKHNKHLLLPLKTVWDNTYPLRPEMLNVMRYDFHIIGVANNEIRETDFYIPHLLFLLTLLL